MGIPEVESILEQIKAIHERKNKDYAAEGKHFENFERSAELISWFTSDEDKTFVNAIGTKLARLATLLNNGEDPLNESVDDSFLDLCTYSILWWGYHQRVTKKEKEHLLVYNSETPSLHLDYGKLINQYETTGKTTDFSKLEGSGPVLPIVREYQVSKYQCKFCGVQFDYTPQILRVRSKRFLNEADALYFDTVTCLAKWKAANLDAQIV